MSNEPNEAPATEAPRSPFWHKVVAHLRDNNWLANCDVCKDDNWIVAESPINAIAWSENGFQVPGPGMTFATVICSKCGNTHLFWVPTLGVSQEDWKLFPARRGGK